MRPAFSTTKYFNQSQNSSVISAGLLICDWLKQLTVVEGQNFHLTDFPVDCCSTQIHFKEYFSFFQMETLTDLVQSQFNDLVAQGTWLTEKTKKLAEDKIRAIIHNIGYPDFILDDNLLQSEVQGLDYKNDKFFENVLQNLRWRTNQEMGRLDERVNRTLWTATPAVVNAYYSRNRNQISKILYVNLPHQFHTLYILRRLQNFDWHYI